MALSEELPAEDWADLNHWELSDLFRRIRATVLELEQALVDRELAERIGAGELTAVIGADLLVAYRQLAADSPARVSPLRLPAVRALLDLAREEIFEVHEHAEARLETGCLDPRQATAPEGAGGATAAAAAAPGPAIVQARLGGSEPEWLRIDQVLSARFWRIGFLFDDAETSNVLARLVARSAARELAWNLRHLRKLLGRFHPRDTAAIRIVPRPEERGFEQLMLDILNEHAPCARRAPLFEDFLEKTDLRVRYGGLSRKRGGRVQVTQITDPERHREKLARIRQLEEFVVLSPLTLAHFVQQQLSAPADVEPQLSGDELDGLWRSLAQAPSDVAELASSLKRLLLKTLRDPRRHPRGPMSQVPDPVRRLIQVFVRHEVFRSTDALRRNERARGLVRTERAPAPANRNPQGTRVLGEEGRHALSELSAGTIANGVVTAIKDYGAFVDIGAIEGLLHVSEMSWSPVGHPSDIVALGQSIAVVVLDVDLDRGRVSLGLKQLTPAPAPAPAT